MVSVHGTVNDSQLHRLCSLWTRHWSVTPVEELARLRSHAPAADVLEGSDEVLLRLTEYLLQGDAVTAGEGAVPYVGVERVLNLHSVVAVRDGWQLEEVATEDDLETAEWCRMSSADLSPDFIQLVEKLAGDHGYLIHEEHVCSSPCIGRDFVLQDLANQCVNGFVAEADARPRMKCYTSNVPVSSATFHAGTLTELPCPSTPSRPLASRRPSNCAAP